MVMALTRSRRRSPRRTPQSPKLACEGVAAFWRRVDSFHSCEESERLVNSGGSKKMEREQEEQLYRLQADLCQVLAEPTRLKLLSLLGERSRAVKDLVEATGERQTKISQHLAIMRQRGIVRTQRVGTEVRYSLADPRILQACRITREVLLQQLRQQARLAAPLVEASGG
jgi:ArsR family transcriptional regulator, virulence genes transcriptional regulator